MVTRLHDWTRLLPGDFHDFHQGWVAELRSRLNREVLPSGYYAMLERVVGEPGQVPDEFSTYDTLKNQVAIFRKSSKSRVAIIKFVSTGTKQDIAELHRFEESLHTAVELGMRLLVVDVFPPTELQPQPICHTVSLAVGDEIADLPLFLDDEQYVRVPLGAAYASALAGIAAPTRRALQNSRHTESPA